MDKQSLKAYQKSLGDRFYALSFKGQGTGFLGASILYVDGETGID